MYRPVSTTLSTDLLAVEIKSFSSTAEFVALSYLSSFLSLSLPPPDPRGLQVQSVLSQCAVALWLRPIARPTAFATATAATRGRCVPSVS